MHGARRCVGGGRNAWCEGKETPLSTCKRRLCAGRKGRWLWRRVRILIYSMERVPFLRAQFPIQGVGFVSVSSLAMCGRSSQPNNFPSALWNEKPNPPCKGIKTTGRERDGGVRDNAWAQ